MVTVTRFAPSPTGSLHLGSARTALFNWLYARHCGGEFLLRIEDTDQERSSETLSHSILETLEWMGLSWDQPYVLQSSRKKRHQEVADFLLKKGLAYYCYCTAEELDLMRQQALSEKRPPVYDRRWRDRPSSEAPSGVLPTVRLKMPLEGETVLEDKVQGRVVVANDTLDDLILLRSDGSPTYMLAVVVDDHDMGVTHIIRGDDHLTNAFRQIGLYRALGWDVPEMAHIPLIHGEDGAKLSKRHGATAVESYREQGFLPEALLNALLRLGWSHQDEERISMQQAVEWFDFDGLGRSAARFDEKKLRALNAYYLRQKSSEDLLALIEEYSKQAYAPSLRQKIIHILPELQKRAETLQDLVDVLPLYTQPLLKEASLDKMVLPEGLFIFLESLSDWTVSGLEEKLRAWGESHGLKLGDIAKPLRWNLTGQKVSPSLFHVMATLGKDWTLQRLQS